MQVARNLCVGALLHCDWGHHLLTCCEIKLPSLSMKPRLTSQFVLTRPFP